MIVHFRVVTMGPALVRALAGKAGLDLAERGFRQKNSGLRRGRSLCG